MSPAFDPLKGIKRLLRIPLSDGSINKGKFRCYGRTFIMRRTEAQGKENTRRYEKQEDTE